MNVSSVGGGRLMNAWEWVATSALPGTERKIWIMAQRAMLGIPIFHPDDARWSDLPGWTAEDEMVEMMWEKCAVRRVR